MAAADGRGAEWFVRLAARPRTSALYHSAGRHHVGHSHGRVARTVRALVADILDQEFVQGLRAKGLAEFGIFRHVATNAAPTALAVMGLQLGYLLGGSILIETVFSWPGTGFLLNAAIFQRDLPLLQGTILVLAMFFVVAESCRRRGADRARSPHQARLNGCPRSPTSTPNYPASRRDESGVATGRRLPPSRAATGWRSPPLRHSRHRSLRDLRALDCASRSLSGLNAPAAEAGRRCALSRLAPTSLAATC